MGSCIPCCRLSPTIPFHTKPVPDRFRYPIITLNGHMTYVEPVQCIPYTSYQSTDPFFSL